MYGQPKTGIAFWVYIFLGGVAGVALLGAKLISKGKKLRASESKGVIRMGETTFLPRVSLCVVYPKKD